MKYIFDNYVDFGELDSAGTRSELLMLIRDKMEDIGAKIIADQGWTDNGYYVVYEW